MNKMEVTQSGEPYEKDLSPPIRKFEVLDNGDVIMKETQITTLKFKANDFKTVRNAHDDAMKQIDTNLSEKTRKELKESKVELQVYIDQLKPVMEDSEMNVKAHYDKTMMDGAVKAVREYFKKPVKERNPVYLMAVLENLKKEEKISELLSRLSPEESKVVARVKIDLFRKQREKKK